MISLISPAKNLNFKDACPIDAESSLQFQKQTKALVNHLKHYEPSEFATLMKISDKLAQQVFDFYLNFDVENYTSENAKQAFFAFNGDVYRGLEAETLSKEQCKYAQNHVSILSGLYGLIRPMDLMQPYRLEMGTKIDFQGGNLYDFWQNTITETLNDSLKSHPTKVIINLASNEYAKAVKRKNIQGNWIDIDFKELKDNKYKTISLFAKRARGMMIRYILDHQIDDIESLKKFNCSGYSFNLDLSSKNKLTFTRPQP